MPRRVTLGGGLLGALRVPEHALDVPIGEELDDLDHAGGAQHLEHVARRHAVVDHPRGARVGSRLKNRNATRLNALFF